MQELLTALLALVIFAFGACVFSFANVLIYRIPRRESFAKGRSHCTACSHELAARDLVPIFSFILLRAKCRYCGEKISSRYMWVELLGGALALLCAVVYNSTPLALFVSARGAVAFAAFTILAVIAFIDYDTMEIPNGLVLALVVPAVASVFAFPEGAYIWETLLSRGIGFLAVSLPMLLLTIFISGAFGGGDIKLMAIAGFMLGWKLTLVAMFAALLIGGVQAVCYKVRGTKAGHDHFAFGPALCAGIALSMLFGDALLSWYLGLF